MILLVSVPILVAAAYFELSQEMRFQNTIKEEYDLAANTAAEAIKEIRTVASLKQQSYFESRYASRIKLPTTIKSVFKTSLSNGATLAFQQLLYAAGFYAAVQLADVCVADYGNSFIVTLVILMKSQNFGRGTIFVVGYVKSKISAIKIFALIGRKLKIDPNDNDEVKVDPIHVDGNFKLKDVQFS